MTFNRLRYDDATYKNDLCENRSILNYMTNPRMYENPNQCRMNLGIVGGNDISVVRGNFVDMESELRGITRNLTKCTTSGVKPLDQEFIIINDKTQPINTRKKDLKSCDMIDYSFLYKNINIE